MSDLSAGAFEMEFFKLIFFDFGYSAFISINGVNEYFTGHNELYFPNHSNIFRI